VLKTAFWGGKKGSIWHHIPPKALHFFETSLMEPPKPRFFMAHEKGSFGQEAKKRALKQGCSFRMQAR